MRSRSWCGFTRSNRRSGSGDRPARGRSLTASAGLALVLFCPMFAGGLDAATGSKIVADGRIESTVGGFRFPDGTVQATAAETAAYEGVVIVAKSGGDYTSIQAALDGLFPAPGLSNRYLIWVAPGIYEEQVTMRAYVDIAGAGQGITKITFGAVNSPTVSGADDAELRDLTVEHTGGSTSAIAIENSGSSPRLTNVTASASGGSSLSYAIYNVGAHPTLSHVTAAASSSGAAKGIYNLSGSSPVITHSTITASGCVLSVCYAFDSRNEAKPVLKHVSVESTAGSATVAAVAIFANTDSVVTLEDVTATAVNGANNSGVNLTSASVDVRNSVITGDVSEGGTGTGIKLTASSGAYTASVHHSEVFGATNTINGASAYTINVAGTLLAGGDALDGGGTLVCAGVIDENYTFFASTCP